MRLRLTCALFLAAALAALAGCGGKPEPPAGDVSGSVTAGGKKLTGGSIKFTPAGGGAAVAANIGYEGTYRATMVPPGDYKVTVETAFLANLAKLPGAMSAAPLDKGEKGVKKDAGPTYVQVPKKYEKPDETTLRVTVKPGVQTADFDCP